MSETRGRITIDRQGEVVVLAGAIDETARMGELLGLAHAGRLVLDLGGVTFINSLGVRDWIHFQSAAQKAGIAIELRRVSEPVVHQLSMIIATRSASRVISFFAPYACDGCGREDSLLIDAIAHADELVRQQPPTMVCSECGGLMSFNDFPERYFSFLGP
jgi:anti-anti-sigma regulatory factor